MKFNVNFSKYVDSCDLLKQSPDYMKKYKKGLAVNKKEQADHGIEFQE